MNFKDFFKQYKIKALNENLYYNGKNVYSGNAKSRSDIKKSGIDVGTMILRKPTMKEIDNSCESKPAELQPNSYPVTQDGIFSCVLMMFGLTGISTTSSRTRVKASNKKKVDKLINTMDQIFFREDENAPAQVFFNRCNADPKTADDNIRKFEVDGIGEVSVNMNDLLRRDNGKQIRNWNEISGKNTAKLKGRLYKQLDKQIDGDVLAAVNELMPKVNQAIADGMEQLSKEDIDVTPQNLAYFLNRGERNSRASAFVAILNDPETKELFYQFDPKPESCGGDGEVFEGTIGEYKDAIIDYLNEIRTEGQVTWSSKVIDDTSKKNLTSVSEWMAKSPKEYPGGLGDVKNFIKYLKRYKLENKDRQEYNERRAKFYETYTALNGDEKTNEESTGSASTKALEKLKKFFDANTSAPSQPIYFLWELGISTSDLDTVTSYEELNSLIYSGENCFTLLYMSGYKPSKKANRRTAKDTRKYDEDKRAAKILKKIERAKAAGNYVDPKLYATLDKISPRYNIISRDLKRTEIKKYLEGDDDYKIGRGNWDDDVVRKCIVLELKPRESNSGIYGKKYTKALNELGEYMYDCVYDADKYVDVYSYQPYNNKNKQHKEMYKLVIDYSVDKDGNDNKDAKKAIRLGLKSFLTTNGDFPFEAKVSASNTMIKVTGNDKKYIMKGTDPQNSLDDFIDDGEIAYTEYGPDAPSEIEMENDDEYEVDSDGTLKASSKTQVPDYEQYQHRYKTQEEMEHERRSQAAKNRVRRPRMSAMAQTTGIEDFDAWLNAPEDGESAPARTNRTIIDDDDDNDFGDGDFDGDDDDDNDFGDDDF